MTTLGAHIREYRKVYGMTQAELARRVGISKTSLNLLELGHTLDPRFSIVYRVSQVLGVSLDTLVHTPNGRVSH